MKVKNLFFQHQKNAPFFFHDMSFQLEEGKMHALHGKNGIGKTILLNLLSGKKVFPQAIVKGEITGCEKSVLVNQRFDQMISDQFSFEENLKFACMSRFPNPFSRLKQPNFNPQFLEKFHIDRTLPAHKLSGGQRQILALLMVLQRPIKLLLLDEPTATLDEQNAKIVFEFLHTLVQQGMTLLVVCHQRELIDQYRDGQDFHLEVDPSGIRRLG